MAESVRDEEGIHESLIDECVICGGVTELKLCAKCKQVAYCSKVHQKQDWPKHKEVCDKLLGVTAVAKTSENQNRTASMGIVRQQLSSLSIDSAVKATERTSEKERVLSQSMPEGHLPSNTLFTNATPDGDACRPRISSGSPSENLLKERASEEFPDSLPDRPAESNFNNFSNSESNDRRSDITKEEFTDSLPDRPAGSNFNNFSNSESNDRRSDITKDLLESGSSEKFILESEEAVLQVPEYNSGEVNRLSVQTEQKMPYFSVVESRNKALGEYVTKCLNCYGLCVIDNFLGDAKGTDILDEVVDMHEHGELTSGQLVNTTSPKGEVRGDVITWVDGSEMGCSNINCLISSIDAIMLHCQRSLGSYHVKGRSKAMVAAYPGNGTHFLRHVDNPSGDGRCVTCIYYLNKSWNSKVDGGLLRIFPEGSNKVANIEPKFDRLLFFWSDRRNPHEVLPAYRTRYAVTVWYYDEQERKRAVKKFKGHSHVEVKQKHVYSLTKQDELNL